MNTSASTLRLDASAIGLSGLCLIHCLALPVLTAVSPIAGVLAEAEWIHKLLVVLALPVSGLVIWTNLNTERNILFIGCVAAGLALLLGAAFIEALQDFEAPLTVAGAGLLSFAHGYRFATHR
ncbi:MAG: MerC domain-containing protein [Rhodospirillaceae bacterium]|nr:MerC domain-containing protein [Rhodospirillaceae bacterium]